MANYNSAGADAAVDYAEQFRQLIANDPDIQRVIQSVWGNTPVNQRPSDTPKHLEKANDRASKQITQILKSKGINLPDRTFVNPRSGALEGHRGWSGLSGLQKALAIGAVGAGGLGAAAGLGAFGGLGAGAGSAASGAGLPAVGSSIAGIGTPVGVAGGSNMGLLGTIGSGLKKLGGGLIKDLFTGDGLIGLGQGLGSIGQTAAHNRGVQLDAMMAGDEMALAAARDRRAEEADIMKRMQQAEYLRSGGANYADPVSVTGKPLGRFDFGVRPATEAEMDMAGTMRGQLKHRLENPLQLSDYASKMEPGKMESILNWLGPITSGLGIAKGGGRYTLPQPTARTQTPTPAATPFTPTIDNAGGQNPWSKVKFTE